MKKFFVAIVAAVYLVLPTQSLAFAPTLQTPSQKKQVALLFGNRPLRWARLRRDEKVSKLATAKNRLLQQIQKTRTTLNTLRKRAALRDSIDEFVNFLRTQESAISSASTPEELEKIAKDTQSKWLEEKAQLKELLKSAK